MPCDEPACTCHSSPEAEKLHGQLLEHMKACGQCSNAGGRRNMCPVGAPLYGRMLAWLLPPPDPGKKQ